MRKIYKSDPNLQVRNGAPDFLSWDFYAHPESNEEVKKVLSYLNWGEEVCFRQGDVEKIKSQIIVDALIKRAWKEI
jgi:hypothetical protein